MDSRNVKSPRTLGSFSRRGFLTGAAAVAAAGSTSLRAASTQIVAYVGAYTDRDGNALYIYDLNPADGTLTRRTAIQGLSQSFVAGGLSKPEVPLRRE